MRAPFWVLAALLAACLPPFASAQGDIAVEDIVVPERTMAGQAFEARVTLRNDGAAREVTLFAALYEHAAGAGPCGSATDPRFRTFTHVVQERVSLPAGALVEHPAPGERWLHRYERDHVDDAPSLEEFCVFVADAGAPAPAIEYEAFGTTRLSVRGENRAPTASFSWSPIEPGATQDVVFEARAEDAEGDPVSYRWDFGHENASGRAQATGARVTHFFYPAGEYVVTLTASDGLNETRATRSVRVHEEPATERGWAIPQPWPALVAALAIAASLRRR